VFLLRWAAQIDQRVCTSMQPTTEGRNGVQPTPMLLGLCNPSVNRTEFTRQFNYFAVQMTTFRTVQNQRVTSSA